MSSRDIIEVTASLIGGAGIGAALMYLFDPDHGDQRREAVADSAGHALDATKASLGVVGDAASHTWEDLSEHVSALSKTIAAKAKGYAGDVADAAKGYAGNVADAAKGYASKARSSVSDAKDAGHDWLSDTADQAHHTGRSLFNRASKTASSYADRARSAAGYPRQSALGTTATVTVAAVGALALGAGIMWFLDPNQGERRRRMVRDKASQYSGQAGEYLQRGQQYASQVASQAGSYVTQAGQKLGIGGGTSDQSLSDRVLTEIGHAVPGHTVQATVTGGRVRLSGYVGASQVEDILSAVRAIPGVSGIDNELDVRDYMSEPSTTTPEKL